MTWQEDSVTRMVVRAWRSLHGSALFAAVTAAIQYRAGASGGALVISGAGRSVQVPFSTDSLARACVHGDGSPVIKALRQGRAVLVPDVRRHSSDWGMWADRAGLGSVAGVPLPSPAGVVAAVAVYTTRGVTMTADGIRAAMPFAEAAAGTLVVELREHGLPGQVAGRGGPQSESAAVLRRLADSQALRLVVASPF